MAKVVVRRLSVTGSVIGLAETSPTWLRHNRENDQWVDHKRLARVGPQPEPMIEAILLYTEHSRTCQQNTRPPVLELSKSGLQMPMIWDYPITVGDKKAKMMLSVSEFPKEIWIFIYKTWKQNEIMSMLKLFAGNRTLKETQGACESESHWGV